MNNEYEVHSSLQHSTFDFFVGAIEKVKSGDNDDSFIPPKNLPELVKLNVEQYESRY